MKLLQKQIEREKMHSSKCSQSERKKNYAGDNECPVPTEIVHMRLFRLPMESVVLWCL